MRSLDGKNKSARVIDKASKSVKRKERRGRTCVDAQHCAALRATLALLHWTGDRMAEVQTKDPRLLFFSQSDVAPPNVYFLFGDIRDLGANTNRWGVQRVCADILEYVVLQGMYHASPGISG
jgi:hypothetical protein